jgi:hypothetical protein
MSVCILEGLPVKWVALLLRISEVPGADTNPEIGHPDRGFLSLSRPGLYFEIDDGHYPLHRFQFIIG